MWYFLWSVVDRMLWQLSHLMLKRGIHRNFILEVYSRHILQEMVIQ